MAASFPPPAWAVPSVIAEGVNVLAGPPKAGKSWLALGLGLAVASGGRAFDSIDVDAGPVLYLALEDTPRRLQERMGSLLQGSSAPAGLTLDLQCPALPGGGVEQIADWIERNPDARMVIIDVFAKVRGNAAPSVQAYDADYAAVSRVKRIADDYGIAIVLLHHVRKAGAEDFLAEVSGTHGIAGAADAVLVLKRSRGEAVGALHVTGRDIHETDYALSFDDDTGAWTMLDGPAHEHFLRDTRARVAQFVRRNPGVSPRQIAEALNLKETTARSTCRRMAEDEQLRAVAGKYYPRDDPDGATAATLPLHTA
ncbi:MAG: AAA family ATPase [Actinophytocola sp.]|nr:AAA family ATPase [Actinophytocola sp.]